jgi:transposase
MEDTVMAKAWLPDPLWAIVDHLLPRHVTGPQGGRPTVSNRQALTGIPFAIKTGLYWEILPAELNCGCGISCWQFLRDWQADGTWDSIHACLLAKSTEEWNSIRRASGRFLGGPNPARTPRIAAKRQQITPGG